MTTKLLITACLVGVLLGYVRTEMTVILLLASIALQLVSLSDELRAQAQRRACAPLRSPEELSRLLTNITGREEAAAQAREADAAAARLMQEKWAVWMLVDGWRTR
jgi:hypothetical protein